MDVVKVFVEEPLGLESLSDDLDPDARRRAAPPATLDAFLAADAAPYARAYLAGTHLGPPRRVGLTALGDAEAWVQPLLAWAGDRPWSRLDGSGSLAGLLPAEAAGVLRQPRDAVALALGPAPADALAAAAAGEGDGRGQRRDGVPALRAVLDAGAVALFPETAHDGHDWSVFARRPLRDPLVDAFRQRPAPGAVRIVAPYRRARGEHTFYLEQWALDALPDWAETV